MLQRPWLAPIVVAFWCITTGWLVMTKILPSMAGGSPPGYQASYTTGKRMIPVAWTVQWDDQTLGWAVAETQRTPTGGLLVDSRMHFERLPLDEMMPAWTKMLVERVLPKSTSFAFDAHSRLSIDAAGELRTFVSEVDLPGSKEQVYLTGNVNDGSVAVSVQAGEMRYETSRELPTHAMISDELSPQATMTGLYEGRRWTAPVFSPLRATGSPIEILHAEVGGEQTMYWEGQLVRVHVVTYREDPTSRGEPRSRMWVDRSGRVLKQEASMLGATLSFVRRTDEGAASLVADQAERAGTDVAAPSTRGPLR